jgi:hypothetical protein
MNLRLAVIACATIVATTSAARATDECRPAYVVPYAEQCDFNYRGIRKDQSIKNVGDAYDSCARAQAVAIVCVKSPERQVHLVALGALYRDVTEQAEIALFTQHFTLAEALLREKRDVLRAVQKDRPKNDPQVAHEGKQIASDLQDAKAGDCTLSALQAAAKQGELGRNHRYADLSQLLFVKAEAFATCAPLATTVDKRAYIHYEALVALEESGRAAQAADDSTSANARYAQCASQSNAVIHDASPQVRKYLTIVHAVCEARLAGTYPVDKPQPLDTDAAKAFITLQMPT